MNIRSLFLPLTVALCLIVLTIPAYRWMDAERANVGAIPREIAATRVAMVAQANALRTETLAEIDAQAKGIRRDATYQLTVIRKDALAEIDSQLTGARADLRLSIAQSVDKAVAPIEGIRTDLQPVLANAARLEAHTDEGVAILSRRDALPAQLLGFLGAAKVTAGETAETMRAIRNAAPQFIATGQVTNAQVAGVVTDVHKLTTKFTAPLTKKQKIWEAIKAALLVGAHFLP